MYEAKHLDFEATYQKICSVIPGTDRTRAGRDPKAGVGPISFRLRPANIAVLIFPKGPPHKIQVAWTDDTEKEVYLPKLQSLLVPVEGQEKVTLIPSHMNVVRIPYPGPLQMKLAWCNQKFHYFALIKLAKALLFRIAFAVLFFFEFMCFWGTFGVFGAFVIAFLLVCFVWEEFERKFGDSARLVKELDRVLGV